MDSKEEKMGIRNLHTHISQLCSSQFFKPYTTLIVLRSIKNMSPQYLVKYSFILKNSFEGAFRCR
jgi:hypothetical protein